MIQSDFFPSKSFDIYFEPNTEAPLVVTPGKRSFNLTKLIKWGKDHQGDTLAAVKRYGAVVFSGFGVTPETFVETYTALTGQEPQPYNGDVPRKQIFPGVYNSTAGGYDPIGPHQEGSASKDHKLMPEWITFFCVTKAKTGGDTQVVNVKEVSETIKTRMPGFWDELSSKKLTCQASYLAETGLRTWWTKRLNKSHATVKERFGTNNHSEVEAIGKREGFTCLWDGDRLITTQTDVPTTIERNGTTLFCNQVHLDRFNSKMCGGHLRYLFGRIFLYPTSKSMQFDVRYDDGTTIKRKDAARLYSILQENQQGRPWKKGDIVIIDNVKWMHAKTKHKGEREIWAVMAGSAVKDEDATEESVYSTSDAEESST